LKQVAYIPPFNKLLSTSSQKENLTLDIDLVTQKTFVVLILQTPIVHSTAWWTEAKLTSSAYDSIYFIAY